MGFKLGTSRRGSTSRLNSAANITLIASANTLIMEYLVVAGGGAGGTGYYGGGAGAGGYLTGNIAFGQGSRLVTVVVGAGGALSPVNTVAGGNGANSNISGSFTIVNAVGGGGGGSRTPPEISGKNGGSGGGSGLNSGLGGSGYEYPGPTQQGYPGGTLGFGSSGGGAGAAGIGGGPSGTQLAGGIGLPSSITGTAIYYAGGGGGGNQSGSGGGQGGLGGGGAGGSLSVPPAVGIAGLIYTGGGGGGGGNDGSVGGNGGSGIVIVRYPSEFSSVTATGANVIYSFAAGKHTYKFSQSGTITMPII